MRHIHRQPESTSCGTPTGKFASRLFFVPASTPRQASPTNSARKIPAASSPNNDSEDREEGNVLKHARTLETEGSNLSSDTFGSANLPDQREGGGVNSPKLNFPNFLKPKSCRVLGDDISYCSDGSKEVSEDLLALQPAKSFDESCEDERSAISTPDSNNGQGVSLGNLRLNTSYMGEAPSDGGKDTFSSDIPLAAQLTVKMSNLQTKPELLLQDYTATSSSGPSIYDTPIVTFPIYGDVPTPPTPRHMVKVCQFDYCPTEVPENLLLPTFLH